MFGGLNSPKKTHKEYENHQQFIRKVHLMKLKLEKAIEILKSLND
jgi:hypothetical protein